MDELTENKARIRNQALHLFMQYGARSVSMDDIATALGSSKKTIYQYYNDKDSLVMDTVAVVLEKNCRECEADRSISENAIHEFFMAITKTAELFRHMNPVLMNDLKKYHPKAYRRFVDYKGDFLHEVFTENMQRGIREGVYREDINIPIIARFRVESIMIPFTPDFYNKVSDGLEAVQRELFYFFLYGLATPKGYKLIEKYRNQKPKNSSDAKD